MLWTMHVTPDPDRAGGWRMFYTGLSRSEYGRVQRVGVARSADLYHWQRDTSDKYPLQASGSYYESRADEGRHWVSFRDPFFYRDPASGDRLLLTAARVKQGPLIRRGCVGLARETEPDRFELLPPLHHPGIYDDIEVPNLFHLGGRYYLLGSIREDTKVHYWYANTLTGPYENYFDNVLLPVATTRRGSADRMIGCCCLIFSPSKRSSRAGPLPGSCCRRRRSWRRMSQAG